MSLNEREMSLDERIALLTSLLTDPPDDADVPALQGYLGGSQLERFERDGTTDELDASITRLVAALATAPGHPDAMYWYHGLGVAYTHRAARSREIADHNRAVHWLNRLHDRLRYVREAGPGSAEGADGETWRVERLAP